ADQLASDHIVQRTTRRSRALPGQHLVVIAVIRHRLLADAITLRRSGGSELAQWAVLLLGLRRPVKPVLLPGGADDALRINAILGEAFVGIFLLRVDIGEGSLDGAQLVAADAAIENLLAAGRGIEAPAVVLAHERDRERP